MNDKQIEILIDTLRASNNITPLQKDILDTWHELQKNPFDEGSAYKQIANNNFSHPDVFMAINAMPGVVYKPAETLTRNDIVFTLHHQLQGLVAKEMEARANGNDQ